MTRRTIIPVLTALISAPLFMSGCSSTDSGKPKVDTSPAAMEAMMKELGTPDEHHRRLDPIVGEFRFTSTMWMDPGQPAIKDEGTCSNRWTLGNLYLEGQVRGTMMGKPFEGRSYMGYDKSLKKYAAIWLDSSSTMFMPVALGTESEDGKSITLECDALDPMTNVNTHIREVLTIQDYDHHVFTMYMTPKKGEETKGVEIVYSRIR
jgi:hypothetical protein